MRVVRKLNNNVVIAEEEGEKVIVFGKGIGFNLKANDTVPKARIDQIFWNKKTKNSKEFDRLLNNTRPEYFEICNEIVQIAQKRLKQKFDSSFYFALLDHLQQAVKRLLAGVDLPNFLLSDISRFYAQEYEIGLEALGIVNRYLKISLPKDEAGFIAFHIVNYEDGSGQIGAQKAMTLIHEVFNIVKYQLLLDIDEQSFAYQRFLTHLKFFSQRLLSTDTEEKRPVDTHMYDYIKTAYHESYECAEQVAKFIKKKYGKQVENSELMYLAIHIHEIYINSTVKK
ncbi:PRD domain-containing protein [Lactobacillus sp. ESL0785]|uniref:PRD domain-containing protein n=1 Tax=Lactobacillus sp. ESL0785 TaxID=2983232 RepID=UPI0023F78115|nr:PRD domain-containing protein [Lactobacillus sp. ESL0785]WEV71313.1 PRD domain-containing protein [Lactobacillus sp. ESL0785]